MTGTIKRLVSGKGFRFVESEGSEYFFHQAACYDVESADLREAEAVIFNADEGPKRPRAERVPLALDGV